MKHKKVFYLTIDDGPSCTTERLLEILALEKVRATFFVTAQYPDYLYLLKQIVDEGHAIGLHSDTHDYSTIYTSLERYKEDLANIKQKVKRLTGVVPDIMRFPGGTGNTVSCKYKNGIMGEIIAYVLAEGYVYFDWNAENGDGMAECSQISYMQQGIQSIAQKDTVVFLSHTRSKDAESVESLREIIRYAKKEGYVFEVLDRQAPPIRQKPINV